MRAHNEAIAAVAREFANVALLSPVSFMSAEELAALKTPHHFDRMVYFRIFRHIMDCIPGGQAIAA
jgi:hypothetical protein